MSANPDRLLAGVGRVNIDPPLPADPQGFFKRAKSARMHGEALEIRALALGDHDSPVLIITADVLGIDQFFVDKIRAQISATTGVSAKAILLNSSHSHCALWLRREKVSGEFPDLTPGEQAYFNRIPHDFATAALIAVDAMQPARAAGAVADAGTIAVNRRERTPDGRIILGWNPDGFIDRDIPIVRIDRLDGEPIATVVSFGCHPISLGPDYEGTSADYVGPLRRRVEESRGGMCLFLQGAGGDIMPLEALWGVGGAEQRMGDHLATEIVHAAAQSDPARHDIQRLDFSLLTPVSLYRRVIAAEQPEQDVRFATADVDLPITATFPREDLLREFREKSLLLDEARQRPNSGEAINSIAYHVKWLAGALQRIDSGQSPTSIPGEIWACRIGSIAIIGAPGEIFSEIGHQVRTRSQFDLTLFAGYSQGVLGYIPTSAECAFGGYEPAVAYRGYHQPGPFTPETERILVESCLELLNEIA